jgi:hypothetical protein
LLDQGAKGRLRSGWDLIPQLDWDRRFPRHAADLQSDPSKGKFAP